MTTRKGLRGLQVMVGEKCVGRVVQGALCDSLRALDGLWLDRGVRGMRFLCAEHIRVIGAHCVVADDAGQRLKMKPRSMLLRAISTDGARLGAIADAAFDETSLAVKHLILYRSWTDAFLGGVPVTVFCRDLDSDRVIVSQSLSEKEEEP